MAEPSLSPQSSVLSPDAKRSERWRRATTGRPGEPGGLPAGLTADVRALIEMMARGGIAELSLATSAVKLRLRAHEAVRSANGVVPTGPALEVTATIAEPEGAIITAPMLGTSHPRPPRRAGLRRYR